jgi:hypothetical protein
MHLLWNHCRLTPFHPNCMFITRHYLISIVTLPIHHALPPLSMPICTSAQSGMSVMLNDTGFTGFNGLPRKLSLQGGHTW